MAVVPQGRNSLFIPSCDLWVRLLRFLFSHTGELPNLQFLCFDNDTTMGGLRAPGRRAIRWNARHKKPLPYVQWNARVGGTACLPQRMG